MRRRVFLKSSGLVGGIAVAGCSEPQSTNTPEDRSDPSTSNTSKTKENTPEAPISILNQDLIHEEDGNGGVRVEATAKNVSGRNLGQVVATATFVEGDALVDSRVTTANLMKPKQRWHFSIHGSGIEANDADAVDDVRVSIEERTSPNEVGSDRVKIIDEGLVQNNQRPTVEGVAKNTGEERLEYMEISVMFTDAEGMLLGSARVDTVRDVDPGQEFQFSVGYSSTVRPDDDVADYQLTAEASIE